MANGKRKGSNYEREISKKLSLWLSNNKDDSIFWRSQNSGGRHTIRYKKNQTLEGQSGDIASTRGGISEDFLKVFSIEIKFYKDINLWGIITKSNGGILDFWKQADEQSRRVKKVPILITKENYKPTLFISTRTFYDIMKKFKLEPDLEATLSNQKIFIWKLESIMKVDPKKFMSFIKK